ncbi:enoyl-CoA hydratase/isomerase family protein [Nocardia caishijiensis]|uniref:3-hydroxyisobutyryl-CoA hydrolase n=1 Tax=Nocardia caishijiensis TaxID=184756 RepID=A0ABQ6YGF8_9NOCA|nr:enoyl-CoA hydratase/isomerase family protein [Nocardia caishijiensis]KAF0844791.1 enoyl-CoA hydratase [Nocardia caishijiensis]
MTDEPEVLITVEDGLGRITLNRPKAINALNHAMVLAITDALRAWAVDDTVRAVVVTGAGERGLCAGGDIVAIHADAKTGNAGPDSPTGVFWRDEYILNALIGRYAKPYVVIMDGIVMGGGVGLSGHGSHRVVTERSRIGMPEVGIGFVPDVGGTHLLSRAPGELGTHVALTTARMTAGDAVATGFADHYVPSAAVPALLDSLRTATVDDAIAAVAEQAPPSELLAQRHWIDACYSADTVEEIAARLQSADAPEATKALDDLLAKSPVALKVTLRALRAARDVPSLESVLKQEYRVSVAALGSHDLVEGIRAQVVDKDRNPQWKPASLAEVTDAQVAAYFADLGDRELDATAQEAQ